MANETLPPDRDHDPATPAHAPATSGEPSLGELFRQLAQDSATLIRQEMALAKTELTRSTGQAAARATGVAIGAVTAILGVLVLIACLVVGVGSVIGNYWLSALIVGLLLLIVGGVLASSNLKKLRRIDYRPDLTLATLKEDKRWAQAEVQQVKRDLTA